MALAALRFDSTAEDVDRWLDALPRAGALSIDIADAGPRGAGESALYGEHGTAPGWWPRNRVTALFPADVDAKSMLQHAACLLGVPVPRHSIEALADADWVRESQSQFAPIRISERLWIVPSWHEPVDRDAISIVLDPGLAFGTGSHPTTRLCLTWLARELASGLAVLDYGCGSGILAIAAAKLGACSVTGVDVDPEAIAASRMNAQRNQVNAAFGEPGSEAHQFFDVVVANILAGPLVVLAPLLASRVRVHGRIVLSGILESQRDDVAAAYSQWFNIEPWGREEGWIALAGVRSAVS